MVFDNDCVRIGPTGVDSDLFQVIGRTGKLRKGKREEIPAYFHSMGINAYEFAAGQMAKFSDSPVYTQFRINCVQFDVKMSIHAPYYISFTSENPEIYQRSISRLAEVYAWATYLNAQRIIFHPGSYGQKPPVSTIILSRLVEKITTGIREGMQLADQLYPDLCARFHDICLCPEIMGKVGQLGTLDEVIMICKEIGLNRCRPCIDFGHLYARFQGKLVDSRLYISVYDQIEQELGSTISQSLHIHYSRVKFTKNGEQEHVTNQTTDWGPNIIPLYQLIAERGYTPTIINESPALETDAKFLVDQWTLFNRKSI